MKKLYLFSSDSLATRITAAVVSLVAIMVLLSGGLAYREMHLMTLQVADRTLDNELKNLSEDLQGRLSLLVKDAESLAQNDLIINALADDLGREVYLLRFLSGFDSLEGFSVSVTLTDFEGVKLASNKGQLILDIPQNLIEEVVDDEARLVQVRAVNKEPYLVVVEPVIYGNTGRAEGALVLKAKLSEWLDFPKVQNLIEESDWVSSISLEWQDVGGGVGAIIQGDLLEDGPISRIKVNIPWVSSSEAINLNVSANPNLINAPLKSLLLSFAASGIILLIVAVFSTSIVVRVVIARLLKLRNEVESLNEEGGQRIQLTADGRDEIADLAAAFNKLILELSDAYKALEEHSDKVIDEGEKKLSDITSAVDQMTDPVVIFDKEDRFIFTNEPYRKLNASVADTIEIGEKFEDHIRAVVVRGYAPDAVGQEEEWIERRLEQHRNPKEAFELHRQDDTWYLGNEKKLPGGGTVLSLTNITSVKEAERERQASERRFRSMVESAGDAIYIHDRYGKIYEVNKVASEQTGYTHEELIGMSVAQLDAAIDFKSLKDTWDLGEADPSQYPLNLQTAHKRKDGSVFPMEVRISLLPSDEHGFLFVAMVRDITERKQVEQELEFQKSALDQHAIVSVSDVQGEITYVNDKFCEISGYKREELLGQNHRMLKSNYHDKGFYENLWGTISSGSTWHGQIKNKKKDGGDYWVDATIVPFLNENGKPFQYIAIRTDITERFQALNDAEKASRAKSEFLSSMSHELRTPLNAIMGFGQLLAADNLDDSQKDSIHEILKAGDHLLGLINDVLDLAKIESGYLSISIEDVDPCLPLNQCLNMAISMAKKSGVTVEGGPFPGDLPNIRTDQTRFKQVLLNFLSNAIKYNREKGRVTLSCDVMDGVMRFSVEDTGQGIPESQQKKLFVPFNRLGKEGTAIEGTGIGLVITKELVALMGGKVGFESTEGKGSIFWFELPLVVSETSMGKIDADNYDSEQIFMQSLDVSGKKTVLYVEDNPANLKLVEKIISRVPGIELISAITAELGIEMAREELPDLVLMDINLPGISGIDAMNELKKYEETRTIPVIALSAAAMDSDIERGMDAGFVHYLTKPIKVKETLEAIESVLKERSS